ncbi:MAG: 4-hydroxyphenylacetate 3-hydroxylase family protein [Anaerolineae bacterium]
MRLGTGADYTESIRALKTPIWAFGEKIVNVVDHPLFRPHLNAVAKTYDLALDPLHEELMTATSHLTGETISRFNHIHQSKDDLLKKVRMLRMINQQTACCIQRCAGMDALNATYTVTYEIDQKYGTTYHDRFREYLKGIQRENLVVIGAMTDVKGDRSLPPSKQLDPDLYLHVIEERSDGIVVRGAKAHLTGVSSAHEVLVFPTVNLGEEDKAYAVVFSLPINTPGITYIFGRQTNDIRKLEPGEIDKGNAQYAAVGGECLTIFDNVFVPWDRVFMYGEWDFAGTFVERFASAHRQNYGACKGGIADVLIGAVALLAEYNGVAGASHVRDKIVEMVHLTETLYSGSLACSLEGSATPSGAYVPDTLLANSVKQNTSRFVYELGRLAQDISGGLLATLPSEADFRNPELRGYMEKYLRGAGGVPAENKMRLFRLVEMLTGGTAAVEAMHGAGSPQAQRIMMLRQGNLRHKAALAKKIAGIGSD